MSNKSILLAAGLAAFMVAGCAQETASPDGAAPAAADAGVADGSAAAMAPCPDPAYRATPDDVALDQAFLVRQDRLYVTRTGAERRRTSLEIQEGDPRQLAERVVGDLVGQGYRQIEVADRGDGIARYAVTKRGVGRVNVAATTDLGARPSHPRSVGVVSFDWPVAGADEDDGSAQEAAEAAAQPDVASD